MREHNRILRLLLAVAVLFIASPRSDACSAVLLEISGRSIMVRNYDWHLGHGLVIVNQPGIAKRAMSFDNPAEWVSKYGSVTVNQYGRELPCDGINETGLAIAILWLEASEYPATDERPSVNTAQWVQYQLDTAATVDEVIASERALRITPFGGAKVHYFVANASGDCAVIEYLDGEMVVHRGDSLPHAQITNNTCAFSQTVLAEYEEFGGRRPIASDSSSLSRYVRLAAEASKLKTNSNAPHLVALETIHKVRQNSTRWQIAYDLQAKEMFFRTKGREAVRFVKLAECNFDATNPVMVLDIEAPLEGDVLAEFREYTREANKRIVERSVAATEFTRNLPKTLVQMAIDYPDVSCRPVSSSAPIDR